MILPRVMFKKNLDLNKQVVCDECGYNFNNTNLAASGALAHRLQCSTANKIQNGPQRAPKWLTGSGKGSNPWLLGAPINFRKISF